jgi:TMEM175 potassium channel family protein
LTRTDGPDESREAEATSSDSSMSPRRLEAFSDGVMAILITIMVLELKQPNGSHLSDLGPDVPVLLTYVLSFVYLGIYWNNHHHLLQRTTAVTGSILWANLHLLFWLSLLPFATAWVGRTDFAQTPTIAYGVVLLLAAVAYYILQSAIVAHEGTDSALADALGRDWKGKVSPALYCVGIALGFVAPWASSAVYVVVALIWVVPDRRLERPG